MTSTAVGRIDRRQLKALLKAYFRIGSRAMPTGPSGRRNRTFAVVLGVYALLGFLLGGMAPLLGSTFLFALAIHTMTFFLVGTTALNEAAEVLFNSRDGDVLGYRPVDAPTLVLAKGITILGLCLLMAAAVNLGPCVLGGLAKDARGWFGPVHALSVFVETVFLCGVVVCLYGVITRYFGAERFQKLVTAAQVLATVLFVVGIQLLPRLAPRLDPTPFERIASPAWLVPPAWFAALDGWLASSAPRPSFVVAASVGLALTVLLAWIGTVRLPGSAEVGQEREPAAPRRAAAPGASAAQARVRGPGWLSSRAWSLWMRDPVERAAFRLCATHMLRERALQVRLAAGLAYVVVMPLIVLIDPGRRGFSPVFIAWFVALVPLNALEMMRISATPDAADLFLFTPIEDPAALFHGARKAAIALVVLPLFLYAAAIALWATHGSAETFWLLVPPLLVIPPLSLLSGIAGDYVPFSQVARAGQRAVRVLAVFLAMVPMGLVGAGMYFAQRNGLLFPALGVLLFVAIGAHVLLFRWIQYKSSAALRR